MVPSLWQIDGETMETVSDFIFLGSRITADGDCSHEIQRHLLLGRKAMTNLDQRSGCSGSYRLPRNLSCHLGSYKPYLRYLSRSWKHCKHTSLGL